MSFHCPKLQFLPQRRKDAKFRKGSISLRTLLTGAYRQAVINQHSTNNVQWVTRKLVLHFIAS